MTQNENLKERLNLRRQINEETGCWEWQGSKIRDGYGSINWKDTPFKRVHRLSYFLYKGEIPDGLHVCHTCDNRKCFNPEHLWLGTHADNIADREAKNRNVHWVGGNHPRAGVTDEQAEEIYKLCTSGLSRQIIADRFGVKITVVHGIASEKNWSHLNLKAKHGPVPRNQGERAPSATLTESAVWDILNSVESRSALAKRYGVKPGCITKIRLGQRWKHVYQEWQKTQQSA